jgi:hypothetical protein
MNEIAKKPKQLDAKLPVAEPRATYKTKGMLL